jgi:hypothetical protein
VITIIVCGLAALGLFVLPAAAGWLWDRLRAGAR